MTVFINVLILVSFFLEICILSYLEVKTWKTVFTPLLFLIIPYSIILILSISLSGNRMGFIDFYYPSIIIWNVGLLIFSIPSIIFGRYLTSYGVISNPKIENDNAPILIKIVGLIICVLFIWHLRGVSSFSDSLIGSDDFGENFAGHGLWGHLRQLLLSILVISIYYVNRRDWLLMAIIIMILVICFLYQVKGWIVIPCIAGFFLRLNCERTKLKISFFIYLLLGVCLLFAASYIVSLSVIDGADIDEVLKFVFRNFLHYLTSGTLGLSMDMQMGFVENGGAEMVIATPINIINKVLGNDTLFFGINSHFLNTGVNLTNVRTIFGTTFIFLSKIEWVLFFVILSGTMYLFKYFTIIWPNIYTYSIYFFECSLLFMGWFDSYFANLTPYEFPVLTLLLFVLVRLFQSKPRLSSNNIVS